MDRHELNCSGKDTYPVISWIDDGQPRGEYVHNFFGTFPVTTLESEIPRMSVRCPFCRNNLLYCIHGSVGRYTTYSVRGYCDVCGAKIIVPWREEELFDNERGAEGQEMHACANLDGWTLFHQGCGYHIMHDEHCEEAVLEGMNVVEMVAPKLESEEQ